MDEGRGRNVEELMNFHKEVLETLGMESVGVIRKDVYFVKESLKNLKLLMEKYK